MVNLRNQRLIYLTMSGKELWLPNRCIVVNFFFPTCLSAKIINRVSNDSNIPNSKFFACIQ